jgi:trimeric autotransporter adhesin
MFSMFSARRAPILLWLLTFVFALLVAATALAQNPAAGTITTIAGTGVAGYLGDGAPAVDARLYNPYGVAVDSAGNVYVADEYNHRIRRIAVGTGIITSVAGDGVAGSTGDGGLATSARLNFPTDVALDAAGNLYIADYGNSRVRRVAAGTGIISIVAGSTAGYGGDGGVATAAQLNRPIAIALDAAGNLFIADQFNHRVRAVATGTNVITTVAGSGTAGYDGDGGLAPAARLNNPTGVAVDSAGNVYLSDYYNHRVRKVTAATGIITTAAGTGTAGFLGENELATTARLYYPEGLAVDSTGNVYVADTYNHRIRKLIVSTGRITTVAGSANAAFGGDTGKAPAAQLYQPTGVAVDAAGNLYIADLTNARVRKVTPPTPVLQITTLAGNGTAGYDGDGGLAPAAKVYNPTGVAIDAAGNVYIADYYNHRIRKVAATTGLITTVAGTGLAGFAGEAGPATNARLYYPSGIAVDPAGNFYIADSYNHRIRKVTVATGVITTVAGNGTAGSAGDGSVATAAQLNQPFAVAIDGAGNIYIADRNNNKIRMVTLSSGNIATVAGTGVAGYLGDGTPATTARINDPTGVAVDAEGNFFIADFGNHRVRKVAASNGNITTLAGTGTAGFLGEAVLATSTRLYGPAGVAVDGAGNVYIGDYYNNRVRKVTVATGVLHTIAGSGNTLFGGDGGSGDAAQLYYPLGIAVDAAGSLYVADQYNNRVRRVASPLGNPTALTAAAIGPTTVRLSWTAGAGAVAYTVKRGTVSGGESVIATGVVGTAFVDTPLATNAGYYYVVAGTSYGLASGDSNEAFVRLNSTTVVSDFDGDRRTDLTIFRPSNGFWYIVRSSTNNTQNVAYQWGVSTDIPVAGDYDGDGKIDLAVFRPSDGRWYVTFSSTSFTTFAVHQWGVSTDTPMPGDYDGDGKTDIAIYRPSTGTWYILNSGTGYSYSAHQWGQSGDVPVTADFDGDRRNDIAVFRASAGVWYVLLSSANWGSYAAYGWGSAGDVPVAGDYDGDGKADPAIYRASTGQWFILRSSTSFSTYVSHQWGVSTDTPVPADFDGDGRFDVAVFRPTTGTWFVLFSSTNSTTFANYQWGVATDIPIVRRP